MLQAESVSLVCLWRINVQPGILQLLCIHPRLLSGIMHQGGEDRSILGTILGTLAPSTSNNHEHGLKWRSHHRTKEVCETNKNTLLFVKSKLFC